MSDENTPHSNGQPADRSANSGLIVTKSNDLIQKTRYSLSLVEQKILLRIIAMIDPKGDGSNTNLVFNLNEFTRLCGNEVGNGNNYRQVVECLTSLRGRTFNIYNPEKQTIITTGWIDRTKINLGMGTVDVTVARDVMPYLTNLKTLYTTYNINYVLTMKSTYSIRIYELLKSWDNGDGKIYDTFADIFTPVTPRDDMQGQGYMVNGNYLDEHSGWRFRDFDVEMLKEMLSPTKEQIIEKEAQKLRRDLSKAQGADLREHRKEKPLTEKYKNFSDFRRFVLDKAFEEINTLTDMDVDWAPLKSRGSKKVNSIRVFIRYKQAEQLRELGESFPVVTQAAPGRRKGRGTIDTPQGPVTRDEKNTPLEYRDARFVEGFADELRGRCDWEALCRELSPAQSEALDSVLTMLGELAGKRRHNGQMKDGANVAAVDAVNRILLRHDGFTDWARAAAVKYQGLFSDGKTHTQAYYLRCVENDLNNPQALISGYGGKKDGENNVQRNMRRPLKMRRGE